ncbi:autotransporter domain-containing protein [Litchfieldella rifensis]|uniref:Autotransporter domain-containing protein n=1 Tax=Litchfieldella rifensis TaxID=762643 RepID=A0ABV7LS50_9GAMM
MHFRTALADSRWRLGGRRLFSVLVGLALFPGMASAYSQLIVFGDSLSDSGQFPDVESIALGEIGSLRFTNRLGPSYQAPSPFGEVSTQRLADALGLAPLLPSTSIVRGQLGLPDGTNYATGDYTTSQILGSITQPGGSVVDADPVSRTRDGYLVEVGTADPEALYYLNGGGNDFLDGLVTGPAEAAASAGTLADGIDALVAAGARTIVVSNLPDVGATPAGLGSGQRDAFSTLVQVYNQALGERLTRYDGQVDIIRLNVGALFDEVVAAPADFGLATGVPLTDVCFSAPGCDVTPFGLASNNPDPSKLLFNDGVHPTTAGHQILADYVFTLLEAPRTLALVDELTVGALNAQQRSIASELRPGVQSESVRVYVHGDHHGDQRDGFSDNGFSEAGSREASQSGAGVGVVVPVGQGWLGAAVTQRRAELEAPAEFELDGQAFSLFVRQHLGPVGVQAIASGGDFELDLRRHVTLGQAERTLKGETEAEGWAAELRADYRLTSSDSTWYTAPFIAYRHIDAEIDGYREAGSVANALIVSDRDVEDRQLEVGLMMDRSLAGSFGVFGEFAWGEYLDDEREGAEVRLASLPTNRWSGEATEREDDHYLRFDTGLRIPLGNAVLQAGAGVQGWDSLNPHFQLGAGFTF